MKTEVLSRYALNKEGKVAAGEIKRITMTTATTVYMGGEERR